jgi:hypothetical protein
MLYVDIPQPSEIRALFEHRGGMCVSIYVPAKAGVADLTALLRFAV